MLPAKHAFTGLLLSALMSRGAGDCASILFEHPFVQSYTVTAAANTVVNFTFTLRNKSCTNLENTVIVINRVGDRDQPHSPLCVLLQRNSTCLSLYSSHVTCSCDFSNGPYRFLKTVDITDNTTWSWSTMDGRASTNISFNITDGSELSLTSRIYEPDFTSTLVFSNTSYESAGFGTIHPELILISAAAVAGSCSLAAILACVFKWKESRKRRKMVRASKTSYTNVFYRTRLSSRSKRLESDSGLQQARRMVTAPTGNTDMTSYQHANQTVSVRQPTLDIPELPSRHTTTSNKYNVTGLSTQATTVNVGLDQRLLSVNSLDLSQREPTGNTDMTSYQHATQIVSVRQPTLVTPQLPARHKATCNKYYNVTGLSTQATTVNVGLDQSLSSVNSLDLSQREGFYYNMNGTRESNLEEESVTGTYTPFRSTILEQRTDNIYFST